MTAGVPAGAPICCSQYSPGFSPFMQLKRVPSAVRTTTCPLPFGPIIEPLSGTSFDLNSVRTDDPFACNHQNANKTGSPSEATSLFLKFPVSFGIRGQVMFQYVPEGEHRGRPGSYAKKKGTISRALRSSYPLRDKRVPFALIEGILYRCTG